MKQTHPLAAPLSAARTVASTPAPAAQVFARLEKLLVLAIGGCFALPLLSLLSLLH